MCGGLYGIINRPENTNMLLTLTARNGQKEDVERSIRYFVEDGIVIRFNRIGFVTKNYGKVGGLGTFKQRLEPMKDASELLQQTYPQYGKVFCRRNGMTEIRFKKAAGAPTINFSYIYINGYARRAIGQKVLEQTLS